MQLGGAGRAHNREMGARVLLEVIAPTEALAARAARVRPHSAVDALVPGELLVARERFAALRAVAAVRPFAGVDANVPLQLAIVGEGNAAVRAHEALRSLLSGAQLFGASLFGEHPLVGQLHFVAVAAGIGGRVSKVLCGCQWATVQDVRCAKSAACRQWIEGVCGRWLW